MEDKIWNLLVDYGMNEKAADQCVKELLGLFNVVAMLPSDDDIEQAAKEEADRLHQFGDDTEWYARSLGFIDGAEFVKNKLHGN